VRSCYFDTVQKLVRSHSFDTVQKKTGLISRRRGTTFLLNEKNWQVIELVQ